MAETNTQTAKPAGLANIPGVRQLTMLIGIAAAVAIGVVVVLWSQEPNYKALTGVMETERTTVMSALDGMKVPYRMDSGSGMILVPAEDYQSVMARLQGDNLLSGDGLDLNSLYPGDTLGQSQFKETTRARIALQNQIAVNLMTIRAIQSAEVLLALPARSAFIRDRKKPEASVMVVLKPGIVLDEGQVQAIVHMVASSVSGLETKDVSVTNQHGELLTSPNMSEAMSATGTQFAYQQKVQDRLEQKVQNFLRPMMGGPGRVRVMVNADIDFTESEQTRESFDPGQAPDEKIRAQEEETAVNAKDEPGAGVAGSLANNVDTTDAPQGDEQDDETVSRRSKRRTNYELDKATTYTKNATGTIRRLSIALLLDHKSSVNDAGEVETRALTEAELQSVSELAKKAVGFDEARGDELAVTNEAFPPPPVIDPPEPPPIWTQAWAISIGKQVLSVAVLLALGFGLLRPLLKNLTEPSQWTSLPAAAAAPGIAPPADGLATQPTILDSDTMTLAKTLAHQDPKRVAQVVKDWVVDE